MGRRGYGGFGPAPETKAWKRLCVALQKETQAIVAGRLGVDQQLVSAIARRKQRPSGPLRMALERELGIPAVDWLTADERKLAFGHGSSPPPRAA